MNSTEEKYLREVIETDQTVCSWHYEPFRMNLANGLTYTPDFITVHSDGRVCIREVKGSMRARGADKTRVKLRVAAAKHPEFYWYGAELVKGQWKTWTFGEQASEQGQCE